MMMILLFSIYLFISFLIFVLFLLNEQTVFRIPEEGEYVEIKRLGMFIFISLCWLPVMILVVLNYLGVVK